MLSLKQARLSRGWSQMDLALEVSIDQSDLSKIERGQIIPRPSTAQHIAEGLGMDWLMNNNGLFFVVREVNDED